MKEHTDDGYERDQYENTPGALLEGLIRHAYRKTGKQVVIIIDEYDAPLLDVIHDENMLEKVRRVMQEFYQPLKANERFIKFCFLTGITRLSQLNIFSTLNNLTNITLLPKFAALCGITSEELNQQLSTDIHLLAESYGCSDIEIAGKLRTRYDGYHFSEKSPDIYNPYSLLSAFANQRISNYWFETGTPTFLIRLMRQFKFNIDDDDTPALSDWLLDHQGL